MSAAVQFYHLTATPLSRALPRLLETITGKGFRVALVVKSETDVEQLNQLLWTYDASSFLAHGSSKDAHPEAQPILLATDMEAPNGAEILFVTSGEIAGNPERFSRIVDMFDGNDSSALASARQRWMHYKNAGHPLSYLQQSEQGGWQQKAAA